MNLAALAESHPAQGRALLADGQVWSWGQVRAEVAAWRRGLNGLGLGPGDRVAIVCPNTVSFVIAYLAVLGVGAVAVPLDPASPGDELGRQLGTVRARAAVVDPTCAEVVASLDRAAVGLEHLCRPADVGGGGAGTALTQGWVPLGPGVAGDNGSEPGGVVERTNDDLAALLFTAGTGGAPKAAMLTHGSLMANLEQMQGLAGRAVVDCDVCLGVLPLFHIYGLNVVLGLCLATGAAMVLVRRFDPAATLELVANEGVTVVAGVPAMFGAWAELAGPRGDELAGPRGDELAGPRGDELAGPRGDELAGVRLAVSGGAPLPVGVAISFSARFGVPLWEGYGLTEASPTVTSSLVEGRPKPGAIGCPLPGVEVRVADQDGADVLVGDPGEIWVRGDNVFAGYWDEPAATSAVLSPEGWLRTGDVAVVDDEGSLRIVDRAKDLIIVSGFNVYPAEVEAVLAGMPGVAEVAVVGVADPRTGEAVHAFVVAQPGRRLEAAELVASCRRRLPRYKCPSSVVVVDALPHGPNGKLLRRELRGPG